MSSTPPLQPSPLKGEGVSPRAVGEVIQASTSEFVAQSHRLYESPTLGALVRCGGDAPIYGVVGEVTTQSIDPGRRPVAVGEGEEAEEAVYEQNPQLNRLLATEFRSVVVGYQSDGLIRRYLAPLPPRIHAFVYECDLDQVGEFSDSLDFLSILLASPAGAADDVTASFLRRASVAHPEPDLFLVSAGKELATLLAGQLPRLNGLLRRLST